MYIRECTLVFYLYLEAYHIHTFFIFDREKLYHLQKTPRLCNSTVGNTNQYLGAFSVPIWKYIAWKKVVAFIFLFFLACLNVEKSLNFILKMHFSVRNQHPAVPTTPSHLRCTGIVFYVFKKVPFWHANVIYLKPWDVNLAQIKSSSSDRDFKMRSIFRQN